MKKRLLLGMMLMGAFAANAQIANGSPAPEISGQQILSIVGNDITYGEQISLQAYLNAGKTVVVDLSAAWCGPCWSFHESHTLEDLYAAYGPNGSDELAVIFVEADDNTHILELGGQSLPPTAGQPERGPSQGNWIEGTNYPIINNDTAAAAYNLEGFPSLYIITPNGQDEPGTVTNLERASLATMVAAINTARGTAMVGVDHWGRIGAGGGKYCESGATVSAYVQSYGHTVSHVEVQLKKDGEVVATQPFDVNLVPFGVAEVTFDGIISEEGANYQAILTQVNNAPAVDTNPENNITAEYDYVTGTPLESTDDITITIHTDEYPNEMKLYILRNKPQGGYTTADIAYQTPNYTNTPTYQEKTFTYNKTLSSNECYTILLSDAYGDGWDANENGEAPAHGVTITAGDGTLLFTHNGTFQYEVIKETAFKTNGTLDNETFETKSLAVYPNPSNGIFNFSTEETIDVTVTDLTGKTVHTAKGIENGGSINLSGLSTGMYIAKINGASGERVEKLIIK
ncbi:MULTISPECIES: T9SS type A sorting domain-containing protein [Flavobacterium]|uniref:T9SS type A sorting domain-containing protein n=1 Tax=Flavobacterium suzhouense TaxID=1529638 RepID=A0ABW5NRS7_9FLAO|nr:T9SS type A sorting domain-containing protein [Flavobacterium sp. AG291]